MNHNVRPFPLTTEEASSINLIAPFWADVDTSQRGRVYYRNASSNGTLLEQARIELMMYFLSAMDFRPRFLFVVTWDGVSFFGGSTSPLVI